ncbi:TetR/AcrR family transcriptional regulator [Streptomyces sp. INA 01156]
MATNRTAKSIATRQRFVDEALRLFKEQGYERTSMAQIAAAAGSSRANLYLYFNSKSQIIRARMAEIEAEVAELYALLDGMPGHTPKPCGSGWTPPATCGCATPPSSRPSTRPWPSIRTYSRSGWA